MTAYSPIPAPAGASAALIDPRLADALGEELRLASRMLADLAYELGSDDATLRRHMTSLQQIDHITQMQLTIADILNTPHHDPLQHITLTDMANRIQTAMQQ